MTRTFRLLLVGSVALTALGQAVAANAATVPADSAAAPAPAPQAAVRDNGDTGGDIIVTAQKRSERLQDVPLSISAITQQSLERQGITRFEDYASRVAGIHLSRDGTQSSFTVRGIATSTSGDTTSATAGIYIDDYPLYDTWFRYSSPDPRIFDVERIEVLRGPQGTLYGATSLSGSIRIITNKPDLTKVGAGFEGTLGAVDGGGTTYAANAMVNVPVVDDKVGIRAVGFIREDGGYIDNPVRGQSNVNGQRAYGGRFYLSVRPNDDLTLMASVFYQHEKSQDTSASYYFPPAGRTDYDWNAAKPSILQSQFLVTTLSVDQQLGAANLNVTATYGENKTRNILDTSPVVTALGLPIPSDGTQPSDSDSQTLEARFTSDASKPFRFIVGGYYSRRFRTIGQHAYQAALIPFYGTDRIYEVVASQRATEIAGYGEGTWRFAPKWEATAGLRVFNNNYHFVGAVSGLLNDFFNPLLVYKTDLPNSQTSATPRFSLSYKPNHGLNIYATVSKGYRFGLTNYNSGANAGTPLTYKSDALWNYELGLKSTFWGGRGSFNTTAYYIDWSNIQLNFRNSNNQVYTTNAGNARSYGIESELSLRPTRAIELNAALTVGHAELTTSNPGILRRAASVRGPAIYGVQAGDQLPGAQDVSASGGIQYTLRHVGPGDAYIRVDDVYVGPSYVDFIKEGSLRIGDYNLVNLRLGYQLDKVEIVAFADNLFNSHGVVNAVADIDLTGLTDAAYRVRPRTIGVTLRARY